MVARYAPATRGMGGLGMMRACEAIYGPTQADAIEELVTLATGWPQCPCREQKPCPLLDAAGYNPLAVMVPEQRAVG